MARYIDADIFQKNLSMEIYMAEDEDFTQAFVKGMQLVKKAQDETPTADVVEVVRCKDCKYFSEEIQHCNILGFCEPNEYCSRGERRKEDETT